jgi:uncharacterized protein
VSCAAALAAPAAAVAQEGAPLPSGPSLQLVSADLRQVGTDLAFGLRFSRFVPVDELDPSGGRIVCMVLRRGGLRLLATGDSMIQIVDDDLKSRLDRRAAAVRSDARIGTGISKLAQLDWIRTPRGQASGFKPDVTIMFLGANDGFPMRTPSGRRVECCDRGWVREYARRVASMMRSYVRGGRSLVYWLTLPTPRRGDFARVSRAVNVAIGRAAARVGDRARVIDLVPVFTPGGRFRGTITFRGRTVAARQEDGIHLSPAGAWIAATLVIDRLRADRALPRGR